MQQERHSRGDVQEASRQDGRGEGDARRHGTGRGLWRHGRGRRRLGDDDNGGGDGGRYGGDNYTDNADVRNRDVVLGQSLQYDNDNCGRMVLGRSLQYDNDDRGRNRHRRCVDDEENRGAELTHGSLFLLGTLCSPQMRHGAVQHLIYNTSRQPFNCF